MLVTAALLVATRDWATSRILFQPERELRETPAVYGLHYRDLAIPTFDGERLHGWWIPAPRQPPLAHLLYCHGNGGNVSHYTDRARYLGMQGLDVLMFDYRGFGRSTGAPSEAGLYADARAARATLLRLEGVASERVFYLGESMGGAVALELALEQPPRGLVLQSTFTSIRELTRIRAPWAPVRFLPDHFPSAARVGRLTVPLLSIHGDRDGTIPIALGRRLFDLAPGPKRWHAVAGGDHEVVRRERESYGEVVAGFVRAVLDGTM